MDDAAASRAVRTLDLDGVRTITLARPEAGNAPDDAMVSQLNAALGPAIDDEFDLVVIDADGEDFCVDPRTGPEIPPALHPADRLARVPAPVIAAIAGRCAGFGLELVLAADIRIGDETATFAADHLTRGTFPAGGLTWRLPRTVGRGRALRWLLSGDHIDARAALVAGLLSDLVARGELADATRRYVEDLRALAPLAMRYAKEAIWAGTQLPLERGLELEADLNFILQSTEDREEGLTAARERRAPRFHKR